MPQYTANVRKSSLRRNAKIQAAQFLEQIVHQHEQELALRPVVLIEGTDCEPGPACDVLHAGGFVTLLAEKGESSFVQACALGPAALLQRRRCKIFSAQKIGPPVHSGRAAL